ncbi:MAG TPA: transcriptional regulator [Thiolinea sp.]|nr:transcriptional regulator [Thiolinea sp.]
MIPARANNVLMQRRLWTERQWSRFVSGRRVNLNSDLLNNEIATSWQRSASRLDPKDEQLVIPRDEEYVSSRLWQDSILRLVAGQELDQLKQLAREGSLVAAVSDPQGYLIWTFASRHMRRRAESVNFVPGGHWGEHSAGTNAVGLSATLRRPTTVFSAEHFLPVVHDWVCYAAPIMHPQSGEMLGVLDISTTWNYHTPLGQAAVKELARSIAGRLPQVLPRAELEIHGLGQPRVVFRGQALHLSHRQLEILCLLVLNPQGLTLDAFHAALYGDQPVSASTLKAELSHMRRMLDGQVGSRPYRLMVSVWADFIEIWQSLNQNRTQDAVGIYRGSFLPFSTSPELEEWRHCIDAVMGRALHDCDDFSILMGKMCNGASGSELVRERLEALIVQQ